MKEWAYGIIAFFLCCALVAMFVGIAMLFDWFLMLVT